MLSSVNCDDYFEWHGFVGRDQENKATEELSRRLPSAARLQRHAKEAAKSKTKKAPLASFAILNASFEYRSHGEILSLRGTPENIESQFGSLLQSKPEIEQNDAKCSAGNLDDCYADPIDLERSMGGGHGGGDDYCVLPPRRQPLLDRSNLPPQTRLSRCRRPSPTRKSVKLRSVSLSPLRNTVLKSLSIDKSESADNID